MPAILSTPAGATIIYLSSIWPWSLHTSSSRKMTFWSDLLSTTLMLLTSSTLFSQVGAENISQSSIEFTSNRSHGNSSEALKHSINQPQHRMTSPNTQIFNLTSPPFIEDNLNRGSNNLTVTEVGANNLVDCNDFTEQKLLNIVICSISDVNNNVINGSIADNSTFNDTALRNISDDFGGFYNISDGSEITGNGNDTSHINVEFQTTLYFIQVITTAVVLGIIILATVIGE